MSKTGRTPRPLVNPEAHVRDRMEAVIVLNMLPPTIREANIVLADALPRSAYLAREMRGIPEEELIQAYFGITAEQYEEGVVAGAGLTHEGKDVQQNAEKAICGSAQIEFGLDAIWFFAMVTSAWTEDDQLDIEWKPTDAVLRKVPRRSLGDLHPAVFSRLVSLSEEAAGHSGDPLSVTGYAAYFDLVSLDTDEALDLARQVTAIMYGPFKALLGEAGLSQTGFARRYFINPRTVRGWCSGQFECRPFLRLLFAESLGVLKRRYE